MWSLLRFAHHARRCRAAWEPHQARCREVIRQAALACPRRRTALVAGSGLCLEIPLEELAGLFDRVILADVLHLAMVRRRVRGLANVALIQCDLTGLDERFMAFVRTGRPPDLAVPIPTHFQDMDDLDLVVSANCLTQLPIAYLRLLDNPGPNLPHEVLDLPLQLLAPGPGSPAAPMLPDPTDPAWSAPPETLDRLGRDVVAAHLAWLAGFPGRVCLIADLERLHVDQGRVLARLDPLFGLTLPEPDSQWLWDIAPRPHAFRDRDIQHRMAGFLDFTRA